MPDPLPAIPLQYATPQTTPRRRSAGAVTWCLWAGWVGCAIAVALIPIAGVESVLLTGPVIFLLGLMAVLGGAWARAPWAVAAGAGHCAACALLVVLVNLLNWSPDRATDPFLWIGGVYTVVSLPMVMFAVRRRHQPIGELPLLPPPPPSPPPVLQEV
jgi:hypothetical protein